MISDHRDSGSHKDASGHLESADQHKINHTMKRIVLFYLICSKDKIKYITKQ